MAQYTMQAKNKQARQNLIDIVAALDDISDDVSALETLAKNYECWRPAVAIFNDIRELVTDALTKVYVSVPGGTAQIYDALEDTRLIQQEVKQ